MDGRVTCRGSATGLSCSDWVNILAKTNFERVKNERPRALRRRIATRVPAKGWSESRLVRCGTQFILLVNPRDPKGKGQDILHKSKVAYAYLHLYPPPIPPRSTHLAAKMPALSPPSVGQSNRFKAGMDAPNHYSQSPSSQIAG